MNGVSNKFITEVLSCVGLKDFHGVFSSDNIPMYLIDRADYVIVCNLSPAANRKGSHFIALVKTNHELHILDSLALPIDQYPVSLQKHFGDNFRRVYVRPIQDALSPFCGFYCILFALSSRNDEIKLEPFKPIPCFENDKICVKNILRLLK
jgi:hypothetical protein